MAFVAVLKKRQKDQEAAAACFAALRKLACNDKLCIELGEAGVVPIALQVRLLRQGPCLRLQKCRKYPCWQAREAL